VYSNSQELTENHVYLAFDDFQNYQISLIATNPCGTTEATRTVTVVPNSITAFFNADPINGCEPLPVQFDQEMFGVTYFAWDFGDGITSLEEDPLHVYNSAGLYTIVFMAGNFCGAQDTAMQTVNVLPAPNFDFVSSEEFLCVGEGTTFSAFGDPIYGYNWSFGDGENSTEIGPEHFYLEEGVYEVSLSAISSANGCPATHTNIIEVITTPEINIFADTLAGCPPFMVNFFNETINAVNYYWNLGDGNSFVGDTLQHVFENSGTYEVEIIAVNSNSCTDTTSLEITVYPQPIADFTFTTFDLDYRFDVNFQNQSENAIAYYWDFGDGNVSYNFNPGNDYRKDGDCFYEPTLTAYNVFGCTDQKSKTINIPFELRVWAPNTFTPDGNNLNEVFQVVTVDVEPEISVLQIFDRWGVMIHEDKGVNPTWDGRIYNELAPVDSYVWKYTTRVKCGFEEYKAIGHVTIVR
jgi:gliding motility-associated-like protein